MPDEVATIDIESPAFAARLGKLLRTSRRAQRRSIRSTRGDGDRFSVAQLRSIERGSTPLDEHLVAAVCQLYRTDLGSILPERPPIAIETDAISALGTRQPFVAGDPRSLLIAYLRLIRTIRRQHKAPAVALRRADIEQLAGFLGQRPEVVLDRLSALMGATAAERTALAALFASGAVVIGLAAGTFTFAGHASAADAPATVEDSSNASDPTPPDTMPVEEQREPAPEPVADAPPASDASGADVVSEPEPTPTPPTPASEPEPEPTPDGPVTTTDPADAVEAATRTDSATDNATETVIADADVAPAAVPLAAQASTELDTSPAVAGSITSPAAIADLLPARRSPDSHAVAVSAPTLVPVVNESACNTAPSTSAMSMVIPDISYSCPVHPGGQASIDAGFVTLVTAAGENDLLATAPGEPGTLWLAAHRTTHGGAFADVPKLADGATITITDDTRSATYRVVARAYVEIRNDRVVDADGNATDIATWNSIVGSDSGGGGAARLLLQTCDGDRYRWMIYAELVS